MPGCLSSVIPSPLNSDVKMPPYETANIHKLLQLDGSPHEWLGGRPVAHRSRHAERCHAENSGGAVLPSEPSITYVGLLRPLLRRSAASSSATGRLLDRRGTTRSKTPAAVRSRPGTTRRHFHRRQQSAGQGRVANASAAYRRIASPSELPLTQTVDFGPGQSRSTHVYRRLQPPLRTATSRDRHLWRATPKKHRLPGNSEKHRPHVPLRA